VMEEVGARSAEELSLWSTPVSFAAMHAMLRGSRARAAPFLLCPVSREELLPDEAWLASDGHMYARDSLLELAARAARDRLPMRSPVTREVLRPWAVLAAPQLRAFGYGAEGVQKRPLLLPDGSWRGPPFAPHVEVRRGTRLAESWSTAFGSACRVALGWEDGDVAEWCFPVEEDTILTPPPVAELRPLARHLVAWLRLQGPAATFRNQEHVLTTWVRIHKPVLEGERPRSEDEAAKEWRTFEELFLDLNRARR
jgi:hypothetical protein